MTNFSEIYSLFLGSLSNDYRLKNLFTNTPDIATDILKNFLIKSITTFQLETEEILETGLDLQTGIFGIDLSLTQKTILSDLMVLIWLEWNINDITQMNLSLNDLDYKHFSEERNLSAKVSYMNEFREIVYHQMSQYNLRKLPFPDWMRGNYEL